MSDEFKIIDKKVGLIGATALTIGNSIGVTMFLLPAQLLEEGTGPSISIAAVLIAVPVVLSVFLMLQLGGAIPAAGGAYVYVSRLVGPFWGFVVPWISVPAVWLGLVFVGRGFAEYVRFFLPMTVDLPLLAPFEVPQISLSVLIAALLVIFLVLNLLGIRLVADVQFAMVAIIIVGSLAFILPGILRVEPGNYQPMFPEGFGPLVEATVSLFISMQGFGLALNIGEEIEDPIRNIPRVIALSTVIGVTLIVMIVVVSVGAVHWTEWAGAEAGISVVAAQFQPPWFGSLVASLVAVVAVFGALTSVNTIYVSFSRLVMRASRDWIFPPALAEVSDRFDSPNRAVLLIGLPPILLVPFAPSPVFMSQVLSLALLLSVVFLAVSAWRLPKVFPQRYEHSFYKLSPRVLTAAVVGGVAVPALFWVLLMMESPLPGVLLLGIIVVGYPVYRLRLWWYEKREVDLKPRMKELHAHEEAKSAGED